CASSGVEKAVPRPARPASITIEPIPCRASLAASIVPEKPPPTMTTRRPSGGGSSIGITLRSLSRPSDLIIGPGVGIGRAGLAADHMVVEAHHRPPGGFGEQGRHRGVDDTGQPGADHP